MAAPRGTDWEHEIINERLKVDREFQERVKESVFSPQSWELVMTAVSFEIVESNEDAHLSPNLDQLSSVLPAIAEIQQRTAGETNEKDHQGIVGRFLRAVGLRHGPHEIYREEAETLISAYATALEQELRDRKRWDDIVSNRTSD